MNLRINSTFPFRCPVCHLPLDADEEHRSLRCENGHSFDFSSDGYINLTRGSAAPDAGDAKEMIRARRRFLSAGFYHPIGAELTSLVARYLPNGGCVIDAGCGEGYYTSMLCDAGPDIRAIGFDLSKEGIRLAAKAARTAGKSDRLAYAVAGIFDLPLPDACADLALSLFAPCPDREFFRVLRPGGILLLGVAGPRHLFGLKEVLYESPYENPLREDSYADLSMIGRETTRYVTAIDGAHIGELFSMTPYYYRTPRASAERLLAMPRVTTEVEVDWLIFRKGD